MECFMIIDKIDRIEGYFGSVKNLANACSFINGHAELAEGRYEFEGGYIISTSGTTAALDGKDFEAHRRYADVMYIISGGEAVSFCDSSELEPLKEYSEKDDIAFYSGGTDCIVHVSAGMFYAVLPGEGHKPTGHVEAPEAYRKYIIKCRQ